MLFADTWSNFPVTHSVDIWAAGCVLYTMCFNKHPFQVHYMFLLKYKDKLLPILPPQKKIPVHATEIELLSSFTLKSI